MTNEEQAELALKNNEALFPVAELQALQKLGANARADGKSQIDCPFFVADQLPKITGESPRKWAKRVEQWTLGWVIEDCILQTK